MKNKINYIPVLICLIITLPISSFSQVNTETLRKEFPGDGLYNQVNLDLGLTRGNTQYTLVRTSYRADYIQGDMHYFGIASYSYAHNGTRRAENRGFIHLRTVYDWHDRIAFEGFIQKEFNEFILLKDRNIFGGGSRFEIITYEAEADTGFAITSYAGLGAMLEHERIDTDVPSSSLVARMTSYLSLVLRFNKNANFKIISYYQPLISNFDNRRFLTEASMNVKVSRNVSLRTTLRLRDDSNPPAGIKPTDMNLLSGVTIDF